MQVLPTLPRFTFTAWLRKGLTALSFSAVAASALAQTPPPLSLAVSPVLNGLRQPWDIAYAPDGAMLFTEKCHGLSVRLPDGTVRKLAGNEPDYPVQATDWFCQGQSGVHGVAVDPAFAQGQRFIYVFSASRLQTNPRTNRVARFTVGPNWALSARTDIVPDIAFKELRNLGGPGAHSGGRIRFGPDGYLWITTGDNHDPGLPQDPKRLGGKTLRVDRDGKAAPGNITAPGFDTRIYTYGHRNPQGIAFRPGTAQVFTAEHGPNHTDEVNLLRVGANLGWDPSNRPNLACNEGYCGYAGNKDSMPMTDLQRFPNALRPLWTNGDRSEGMGPAEFLSGAQWGAYNGALVVSLMRGLRLAVLQLDAAGQVTRAADADMPSLRLRSLIMGPDGALWGSTDDGRVLRLQPRS